MIAAGDLRDRVRLQKAVRTPDGQGGYTRTWQDIAFDVPAQVVAASGTEVLHAGQLGYDVDYAVRLRYMRHFTPSQRVLWADGDVDRVLDVRLSRDPDGRRIELRLVCAERAPVEGGA